MGDISTSLVSLVGAGGRRAKTRTACFTAMLRAGLHLGKWELAFPCDLIRPVVGTQHVPLHLCSANVDARRRRRTKTKLSHSFAASSVACMRLGKWELEFPWRRRWKAAQFRFFIVDADRGVVPRPTPTFTPSSVHASLMEVGVNKIKTRQYN